MSEAESTNSISTRPREEWVERSESDLRVPGMVERRKGQATIPSFEESGLAGQIDDAYPEGSGEEVLEHPETRGFYDKADEAETRRLDLMATWADGVSLQAVEDISDRHGLVFLDIGAGGSTSLGLSLLQRNPSAQYLPIDIKQEYVDAHARAGFDAQNGSATELPFDDNSADVLHARFVLGWLNKEGRARAIEEMLRVSNDRSTLAMIDYDWTVADGPGHVNELAKKVNGILQDLNFDPDYGFKALSEVTQVLHSNDLTDQDMTITESRIPMILTFENALDIIKTTLQPLIGELEARSSMKGELIDLKWLFNRVEDYAKKHPNETVRFPDMVSIVVNIANPETQQRIRKRINSARSLSKEAMLQTVKIAVGPAVLGTYRLTGEMVKLAQRFHAESYHRHGHVTDEGIDADGVLIAAIDPPEVVARSLYIGTFNSETLDSGIRMIEPTEKGVSSMPTIQKLLTTPEGRRALQGMPFMNRAKVFEVSGLGRSSQSQDPLATTRLFLATFVEANELGYDYAVMGIERRVAKMLVKFYGPEALRQIDGGSANIKLTGEGINPEGVTLVPFYTPVETFLSNCISFFEESGRFSRPGKLSEANKLLFMMTQSFIEQRALTK